MFGRRNEADDTAIDSMLSDGNLAAGDGEGSTNGGDVIIDDATVESYLRVTPKLYKYIRRENHLSSRG